jgi:hypothetical protein
MTRPESNMNVVRHALASFVRQSGRPGAAVAALLLVAIGGPGFSVPSRSVSLAAAQDTIRFAHERHESIRCITCHPRDRRGVLNWSIARDCQGCHHAESPAGRECVRCHTPGEMAAPIPVATPVALSVWTAPRTRQLGFSHDRHRQLDCAGCHGETRERTVERTCASCHADHHEASRDCAACHPSPREAHTRELHQTGCGASGCHVRESTPAVTPVRATCLACHVEEKDHKTGRECATCHLISWSDTRTPGRP